MGQIWERLLLISDGRLELTKCFWVPIVWKWSEGKPRIVTKGSSRNRELTLTESETKEKIVIPKTASKETEKRLGIWSNCDGTWTTEYSCWLEFSIQFGKKIKWAGLDRIAGYHAYHLLWIGKI